MKKLFANLKPKTNTSNENPSNTETRSGQHNKRRVNLPSISPGRNTDDQEVATTTSSPITQRDILSEVDAPKESPQPTLDSQLIETRYVVPKGMASTEAPPRTPYANPSETPLQGKEELSQKDTKAQGGNHENTAEVPYDNQSKRLPQTEDTVADADNAVFKSFIGVNRLPAGKISIGERVGSGAFGEVYKGNWVSRAVALKKIDFEHASRRLGLDKREALEALSWEMCRLSTVNHPNLVQFYGIYQHEKEGATYLVTEFCEGGDLRKELNKNKNISWAKRWQWALQITEAVAYLHSEGVLHRDLKAENILLNGDKAKLADLGVAQVDALLQESEAQVVAKGLHDVRFIAPENIDESTLSTKETDIYALGLVLWEIASGEEPDWTGGEPLEENRIPKSCSQSFKELILSCCSEDPAKRPSAEELVQRIQQLGPELNPDFHVLIEACHQVEKLIHPKRKEGLAYIEPFITAKAVEESIEIYWDKRESAQKTGGSNPPLNLKDTFLNFLKKPGPSTLLLLGEAGLGKTLTTYLWADELMRQWWSYIQDPTREKPDYFPIFIRDAVSDWRHSALKGAYLKIVKQYELKDIPTLVFVDGYDELQMDDKAPGNLSEHLGLSESKNAKLIVTCRPKTVEDDKLQERYNFKGALETFHFLPFSINQLLGYLKEQLAWERETEEEYKKTLQASKSVREVLRNPFVLYLLRQSWETLSQQPLNELNRWKIYKGFVEHVITTQSSLLSAQVQASLAANYSTLVESFEVFASDVAFRACQKGGITFSVAEAANELTYPWVKLEALVKEEARKEFINREAKLNLGTQEQRRALLSEADFIRVMQKRRQQFEDDLPLEIRRDEYTFSHKSLFEYFVAKRLLKIFDSKDGFMLVDPLEAKSIESKPEILMFLNEGWKERLIELEPEVLMFLNEGWKEAADKDLTIDAFLKALITKVSSKFVLGKISLLLTDIGQVLEERAHKHTEALEYYLKSLAIFEQVYGKEHLSVGTTYNNIGSVLSKQGKYAEALEYLKKALAILEQAQGRYRLDIAISYNNIGSVLDHQGKHVEALEYYLRSLAIKEQVCGKYHPDVATYYEKIWEVLKTQGKYAEAQAYLKETLVILEKILGEYKNISSYLAVSYHHMGYTFEAQGKYTEALEYYLKSLAIFEQVYSKDNPNIATSYNSIGSVLGKQGKHTEALEYLKKALAIREQVYSEDHPDIANSCNNIGSVLSNQGKHTEALEYLKKALAILEQVYGKDHQYVALVSINLQRALKAHMYVENRDSAQKSQAIEEKTRK